MHGTMHYQLELAGEAATLYITRTIGDHNVSTLAAECQNLPPHVRTLRVDMRAVGTMTSDALRAVRTLLQSWRERRHGEYRLRTSYLIATCTRVDGGRQPAVGVITTERRVTYAGASSSIMTPGHTPHLTA